MDGAQTSREVGKITVPDCITFTTLFTESEWRDPKTADVIAQHYKTPQYSTLSCSSALDFISLFYFSRFH
jgi:hypothetical protein